MLISLITASLVYFEFFNLKVGQLPYWRIDNFLIYLPLAYFLFKYRVYKTSLYLLYLGFIIFSIHDFILTTNGYTLEAYARVSIVFGALAIFNTFLYLKPLNNIPKIINFLSKYSLGIFAIHQYWHMIVAEIVTKVFQELQLSPFLSLGGLSLNYNVLAVAIFTTLLTFASVRYLSYSPLKSFVS